MRSFGAPKQVFVHFFGALLCFDVPMPSILFSNGLKALKEPAPCTNIG
jgi:hypothetical protein